MSTEKHNKTAAFIAKIMKGAEASISEQEEFDRWVTDNEYSDDVIDRLSDSSCLADSIDEFNSYKLDEHIALMQLKRRLKRKRLLVRSITAGVAVLLISFLVGINLSEPLVEDKVIASNYDDVALFIGGSNEVLVFNDIAQSTSVSGSTLIKAESDEVKIVGDKEKIVNNRLVVPKEKSYTVELSDGTKVTLNANSELRFPNVFKGKSREVELKGEAFFDVTKKLNSTFTVKVNGVEVLVHGTKFNVNAYRKNTIETYLAEGSISLKAKGIDKTLLVPKNLSTINTAKRTNVVRSNVEAHDYLKWMNNYFAYEAGNLNSIIGELMNWYGVVIKQEGSSDILVTGEFDKESKLEDILVVLEKVCGVKLIILPMN